MNCAVIVVATQTQKLTSRTVDDSGLYCFLL